MKVDMKKKYYSNNSISVLHRIVTVLMINIQNECGLQDND